MGKVREDGELDEAELLSWVWGWEGKVIHGKGVRDACAGVHSLGMVC